jgi:Tol biopolymer transport system component
MGVVVGLDGIIHTQVSGPAVDAESLSMAPDGRTIVFSDTPPDDLTGPRQIGTIGVDGTGLRYLTHLKADAIMPVWSPDASRVAFISEDQVFSINADGSGLTKLTSDAGVDQWPAWSPDGSTIAYSNSGTAKADGNGFFATQEIWTVPASGGDPTALTQNNVPDDMPSYSPDGARIVFFRDDRIWIMDANGRSPHPLRGQPHSSANLIPRWSPDGSHIVFVTFHSRSQSGVVLFNIHVADLSTGTFTLIPGRVERYLNAPSWVPSGNALLMNKYPA